MLPENIWVIQCINFVSIKKCKQNYPFVQHIHSSYDLKYFARFSTAIHSPTKYIWILDDDVIPASKWVETAILKCELNNSIICSSGRIVPPNSYSPELITDQTHLEKYFIGDYRDGNMNYCIQDTFTDYGCNSWFFKTDWIKYFWMTPPYTLLTGEDIHFSASCKIHAGISTLVPKQKSVDYCGNLKRMYGFDQHASWKKDNFIESRKEVFNYLTMQHGWLPYKFQNNPIK